MASTSGRVQRLTLHDRHEKAGAKFGAFGEWEVPLYYTSILEEHEAVRSRAGLFDISHMGEFFISGSSAEKFLQELLPRNISRITVGQAVYMPLLNEEGGIVDDIILYRFGSKAFLMIVNASNIDKDFKWIEPRAPAGVELENISDEKGLLALQGPASIKELERCFGAGFSSLRYYRFREWKSGMIARTGYTGEDGFEIMVDRNDLAAIWDALIVTDRRGIVAPVGFGCRDTLRLEAGMLLYGHDLNDDTTPLEAGLAWAVDLTKDSFVGRDPLKRQFREGVRRRLIGFEMIDRGIPRQEYEIRAHGKEIGKVTSGSFAPTLKRNIGMGYVVQEEAGINNEIEIMVRGQALRARVVILPFYGAPRAKPTP